MRSKSIGAGRTDTAISAEYLHILQVWLAISAALYATVIMPTCYIFLAIYSQLLGVPLTDVLSTLGIGVQIVVALATLTLIYSSACLCAPAFYSMSSQPGERKIEWIEIFDPRRWRDLSTGRPDIWRMIWTTLPGITAFQVWLLYNMPVGGQSDTIIWSIEFLIVVASTVTSIIAKRRIYPSPRGEGGTRHSPKEGISGSKEAHAPPGQAAEVTGGKIAMRRESSLKGFAPEWIPPTFNFITFGYSLLMLLLLSVASEQIYNLVFGSSADRGAVVSFVLAQTMYLLVSAFLIGVPAYRRKPQLALGLVGFLAVFFAIGWPGMTQFIDRTFLTTRIGGGAEIRLRLDREVACQLPPNAGLVDACKRDDSATQRLPVKAWLSFLGEERLYVRLRKPEAADRQAQIILEREDAALERFGH